MSFWNYFNQKNESTMISFMSYRRLIGILGLFMPITVMLFSGIFGDQWIRSSISIYYYSNVGDYFVGLMFAVSFFLITYKGHDRLDNLVSSATGLFALLLALFPCNNYIDAAPVGILQLSPATSDIIHIISGGGFFFSLSMMSLFIFTRGKKNPKKGSPKYIRNLYYQITGLFVLVFLPWIGYNLIFVPYEIWEKSKIVFCYESLSLFFFGSSWLIKGQFLFPDNGAKERQ